MEKVQITTLKKALDFILACNQGDVIVLGVVTTDTTYDQDATKLLVDRFTELRYKSSQQDKIYSDAVLNPHPIKVVVVDKKGTEEEQRRISRIRFPKNSLFGAPLVALPSIYYFQAKVIKPLAWNIGVDTVEHMMSVARGLKVYAPLIDTKVSKIATKRENK